MLVKRKHFTLAILQPILQVKVVNDCGLWKYGVLQEVVWLPETVFSLLVSILPDKIDISSETCGNY